MRRHHSEVGRKLFRDSLGSDDGRNSSSPKRYAHWATTINGSLSTQREYGVSASDFIVHYLAEDNPKGISRYASKALAGKQIVCLYFSNHNCREFTSILQDFYNNGAEAAGLEILQVPNDTNMSRGPRGRDRPTPYLYKRYQSTHYWPAVRYSDVNTIFGLIDRYQIQAGDGADSKVVVLNGMTGDLIKLDGREDIENNVYHPDRLVHRWLESGHLKKAQRVLLSKFRSRKDSALWYEP
eukprot:g2016.t1